MCGIAGIWGGPTWREGDHVGAGQALCRALRPRGPDGSGTWVDESERMLLVHTRLAVRGLGQQGEQPMVSHGGRYVLSYNGEIYNTSLLKRAAEQRGAIPWRGESDTEVLLAAIEKLGLEDTLQAADGMFAFALWDRQLGQLCLARDRFGEKPLYYGSWGGGVAFSSDLHGLRGVSGFPCELDAAAVADYSRHGYISAPATIYRGARKLPPGCLLRITAAAGQLELPRCYWQPEQALAKAGGQDPVSTYGDALDGLEQLLSSKFSLRLLADVPLGLFLSGGIDSSLIAAMLQARSPGRLASFSIGSPDARFDEAVQAKQVAEHLGTCHTELYVQGTDALGMARKIGSIYDEPFADSSSIPTALLCHLVSGHVKVALSGDGGDELFGGYNRHIRAPSAWSALSRVPPPLRGGVSGLLALSGTLADRLPARTQRGALANLLGSSMPGEHLRKLAAAAGARTFDEFAAALVSLTPPGSALLLPGYRVPSQQLAPGIAPAQQLMLRDTAHYLPGDILVKVDRASMYHGLEVRAPFLDRDILEFAWSLPAEYRIAKGLGKRILRDLLCRHVPRSVIDRPKQGFAVPVADWLRAELREWAEHLLDPAQLRSQGVFDVAAVQALWSRHLRGARGLAPSLWMVLAFQAWALERDRA